MLWLLLLRSAVKKGASNGIIDNIFENGFNYNRRYGMVVYICNINVFDFYKIKRPVGGLSMEKVIIGDVKMKFLSMALFQIKWVIAAIPAIIVLTVIAAFASGFFAAIMNGRYGI